MGNLKQGLSPKEVLTIQMSLAMTIEDMELVNKDATIPLNAQARKELREMLLNMKSAKAKIDLAVGSECIIEPYADGEENEFLTKES